MKDTYKEGRIFGLQKLRVLTAFIAVLSLFVLLPEQAAAVSELPAAASTDELSAAAAEDEHSEAAASPKESTAAAAQESEAGSRDGFVKTLKTLGEQIVSLSRDAADIVSTTVKGEISKGEVYAIKAGTVLSAKKIKKEGGSKRFFHIYKIKKSDRVYKRINGKSYRQNSTIALSDLRYIKTLYYDFDGKIRSGELIVNKAIAKDTRDVFVELFRIKYQIRKMKLIDSYYTEGGSGTDADTASMNDDNTSAFNYRFVAGTSTLSMHGYGRAIDVNPFENPWCPGGRLYPNQSKSVAYADRGANTGERKPHMIFQDSKITKIFKAHGFRWLGETDTHDYQHFEK